MSFRLIPLIRGTAPLIVLHRPVLLIGRHLECDVRINSPKVSRRHCCLAMAYDRVLIRDLGSRNGVRVNGRPVEESRLYDGDELAIGPILFRLEAIDENPETIGAPASRRLRHRGRPAQPGRRLPRPSPAAPLPPIVTTRLRYRPRPPGRRLTVPPVRRERATECNDQSGRGQPIKRLPSASYGFGIASCMIK